jgi:hypothetical protein
MVRLPTAIRGPLLTLLVAGQSIAQDAGYLPGTRLLEPVADRSRAMVAGIDRYAEWALGDTVARRGAAWRRVFTSAEAYARSVAPQRERLRRLIGAVDPRLPAIELELPATTRSTALVAETDRYRVFAVRWPVFADVHGEGLWLEPKTPPRARIVVVPDADETPEAAIGLVPGTPPEWQFARRLAENGAAVLIPVLLDRSDAGSGNARVGRDTNQTHREWIYRQAFQLGRHIIGYEVQKVLAAVDWFTAENDRGPRVPIGVAGYAEGGLIALHAAALDPRIEATLVSGSFGPREGLWREPIYRNVFGLLREWGDAEVASLIAPRALVVEHRVAPRVDGPPPARSGRPASAAPGLLVPPPRENAEREFERARQLSGTMVSPHSRFAAAPAPALEGFWQALQGGGSGRLDPPLPTVSVPSAGAAAVGRQLRQVRELETHTQRLLHEAEDRRQAFFWQTLKPDRGTDWAAATEALRAQFHDEIIGRFSAPAVPANARSRRIAETDTWTGYEVVLDVARDVFTWGYLLVP